MHTYIRTARIFIPDRSQLNAQWIWSSPLTEIGIVGSVCVTTQALVTVHQPPSSNAAANTTLLILARFLLKLNPDAKSKRVRMRFTGIRTAINIIISDTGTRTCMFS